MQFGKIIITGLGYSDRGSVLISFGCDGIQTASTIIAGIITQCVSNSRCAMMIATNVIVLVGSALIDSKFRWARESTMAQF